MVDESITMNGPTVDRDRRWLLPIALWHTDGSARVVASADRGVASARIINQGRHNHRANSGGLPENRHFHSVSTGPSKTSPARKGG